MFTNKVTPLYGAIFTLFLLLSCGQTEGDNSASTKSITEVKVVSAMRNVMHKGELAGQIELDTISSRKGLYGIGPVSYLTGEITINDGVSYASYVTSDSTMAVEKTYEVSAPFFVYANVMKWEEIDLPPSVKTIADLEQFIDGRTQDRSAPFVLKLSGTVTAADIHVQNLPPGSKVSSPEEAHRGQVNYQLEGEEVDLVGFFSRQHQGVFTHHDTFLHIHLLTRDGRMMGHLDGVEFESTSLYLSI